MNKEELKQEANKYAKEITEKYVFMEHGRASALGYLAGAEPREKQIEELKKENERLQNLLNHKLRECRRLLKKKHLAKEQVAELEAQIEKMKCCGNCRFSESDKLNGTFCHREGCFVVASAKCKLWEN